MRRKGVCVRSGSSREQSSCVFYPARARPECTKTLEEDDAQAGEGEHGDCWCWCLMALGVRLEKSKAHHQAEPRNGKEKETTRECRTGWRGDRGDRGGTMTRARVMLCRERNEATVRVYAFTLSSKPEVHQQHG